MSMTVWLVGTLIADPQRLSGPRRFSAHGVVRVKSEGGADALIVSCTAFDASLATQLLALRRGDRIGASGIARFERISLGNPQKHGVNIVIDRIVHNLKKEKQ